MHTNYSTHLEYSIDLTAPSLETISNTFARVLLLSAHMENLNTVVV